MSKIKHEPGDIITLKGRHFQVTDIEADGSCDLCDADDADYYPCGIHEVYRVNSCAEVLGHACVLKERDPLVVLIQKIQEEEDGHIAVQQEVQNTHDDKCV